MIDNVLGNPVLHLVESIAACTYVRNRVYAKRHAKSPRHWARMDKKYLKRYGMRSEPTAYWMEVLDNYTIVVHPSLMPAYRKALRSIFPEYR